MSIGDRSAVADVADAGASRSAAENRRELADTRKKRVLYLSYTDPAGYPPLHHSARMLAESGWHVITLGVRVPAVAALRFPAHERITSKYLPRYHEGWRQKLHYLTFCLWALAWVVRSRARWVYASDAISAPAALLVSCVPGLQLIYHEHDSPTNEKVTSRFSRLIAWTRCRLARRSSLCILPQQDRATWFRSTVGAPNVTCVWNCPSRVEVRNRAQEPHDARLRIVYQGSIVPDRLPVTLAHALHNLPEDVSLEVIGYPTQERNGYITEFLHLCKELGVRDRVHFHGPMERRQLMDLCRTFDVGLALIREGASDVNMRWMVGASNKPFDYLACELPLIVTDNPAWRALYVDAGYAKACDPESAESVADAIRWYLHHPGERRAMGAAGRRRIETEWNYELQFAPVLEHMLDPERSRGGAQQIT